MNQNFPNPLSIILLIAIIFLSIPPGATAEDLINVDRAANTVILDEVSATNLKIETVLAEEADFESTVYAIGRLAEVEGTRSVVSSRIEGRIVELLVNPGDSVKKGNVVARVEARVIGDPPPVIDLKALQDGKVVGSHFHLGEPIEPSTDLISIANHSTLWAVASIPEIEAGAVKIGARARVRIPAIGMEQVLEATLERFASEADQVAGSVLGFFRIDNSEGLLRPGLRAEFSIVTSERKNVLAVPKSAIQGSATKRQVFVTDFDIPYAYVKAPVVLGEENDELVEVISGLFPGDEVVTRGAYALSHAGAGSGMSLKEALDLAHGHEHNEDGSEMTAEQRAAREAEKAAARGEVPGSSGSGSLFSPPGLYLLIWTIMATVGFLVCLQMVIAGRRRNRNSTPEPAD